MAVRHAQQSVTTTATEVAGTDTFELRDGGGRYVTVQNTGSVNVFLGGSGVTTSTYGHRLAANDVVQLYLTDNDQLFAIAGSSTTISLLWTAA